MILQETQHISCCPETVRHARKCAAAFLLNEYHFLIEYDQGINNCFVSSFCFLENSYFRIIKYNFKLSIVFYFFFFFFVFVLANQNCEKTIIFFFFFALLRTSSSARCAFSDE
jgi:hypothetical protein